jgi:hypothetical protein
MDKIKQGKEVGYDGLGIFDYLVSLALWKFYFIFYGKGTVKLENKTSNRNNALGRIMQVYTENDSGY